MKLTKASALTLTALGGLMSAEAGMKQMEIKGGVELAGYTISYDDGAKALRGGGSDSVAYLNTDLDFKMKFSQDVSARIDLELDGASAGDRTFVGKSVTTAANGLSNRFDFGVDQAYFKLNDFLFKDMALKVGKQQFAFSLRDNGSFSWAWGQLLGVRGIYSTRDVDWNMYWMKLHEESDLTRSAGVSTNDKDKDLYGTYGEYWLNDDSLVVGYVNFVSDDGGAAAGRWENMVHYGLGIDYYIGEAIELYAEAAGQAIDAKTNKALDGSAFQITGGFQYSFTDFDLKPELNLEYYLQSGADTSDPAWQSVAWGAKGAENQSLFVEGTSQDTQVRTSNFGAGLAGPGTGGYSAIRLNGWIQPSKSTKVGLGIHKFNDDDNGVTKDDMGIEFDLTGNWSYSPDVNFFGGVFLWTGGETNGTTPVATGEYEDVSGLIVGSALSF